MAGTVVLGLGNLLLGDEGVGVHAARALLDAGLPGAEVLDVGTAILDALPEIGRAERLVVVDAVEAGGPPGSIYRLALDQVRPAATLGGLHGFDLARTLALAGRGDPPPEVVVLGVEPLRLEWSLELSPVVASALPFLLDAVRREVSPADTRRSRA
ncbi:MAG TPA: hydrogenase maturation protease [Vicinamibacteria bacterium]